MSTGDGTTLEIEDLSVAYRRRGKNLTVLDGGSIPVIADGGAAPLRIRLEGPQPNPIDPPDGCRFHTRCPRAMDVCRSEAPPWQDDGPEHRYRCHIAPAELRPAQEAVEARPSAHA